MKVETDDPKTVSKFTDRLVNDNNMYSRYKCALRFFSVYKGASKDHVITNVAGGKTITLRKTNFPDTGN